LGEKHNIKLDVLKYSILEIFVYANMSILMLMSHYFNSLGFSPSQIGILVSVSPVMVLIANPFWFFVKQKLKSGEITLWAILSGILSTIWFVYLSKGFFAKLLTFALATFFFNGGTPITESIVISSMNYLNRDYGKLRILGSIGFSTAAYILGYLTKIDFKYMFIFSNIFILIALIDSIFLKEYEYHEIEENSKNTRGSFLEFSLMLAFGAFAIFSTFSGNTFFTVLVKELKLDPVVVGKQISLMGFSEIPFLFFSKKIVEKINNKFLISLGLGAVGIRWFLTSYVSDELPLLLIQLLQGLNYIVVYYAILTYIHKFIPKRLRDFAQSIYWIVVTGLANIIGTLAGGFVIEKIGVINTYRFLGIIAMALCGVSIITFRSISPNQVD
jgi:PPP family 3-phenylpropionic acid transporter